MSLLFGNEDVLSFLALIPFFLDQNCIFISIILPRSTCAILVFFCLSSGWKLRNGEAYRSSISPKYSGDARTLDW